MNKKAITLICITILLASLQLACSFTDILGRSNEDRPISPPQEPGGGQPQPPAEEEQNPPTVNNSQPPADQSSCTKAFSGSSNISEGQEYQAGDSIQTTFTLTNTGTCTWGTDYSLIAIGGDFSPSSAELPLLSEVGPGESVQVGTVYTAPSQDGVYVSVWKMEDDQGGVFSMDNPPDAPLRIKIRVIPSGSPQPTQSPNPTPTPQPAPQGSNPDASLEMEGVTLLADHCYDLTSGAEVDCSDSKAHIRYSYMTAGPFAGHNMTGGQNVDLSSNQNNEPDKNDCENASYTPLPHTVEQGKFFCFKIESITSTIYGWIRIESYNDNGVTFDFLTFKADPPIVTVNTNLFVETQGQQITLLEGKCYDVWNGEKNPSCSGIFAGFLFEEVTKKSLQVSQINPNEMKFSAAMSSEPNKSDCMNASYSSTPIWPIQSTSYYCYQFVPGTGAYYGWLRPTSFNLGGLTFDYLTWEMVQ